MCHAERWLLGQEDSFYLQGRMSKLFSRYSGIPSSKRTFKDMEYVYGSDF